MKQREERVEELREEWSQLVIGGTKDIIEEKMTHAVSHYNCIVQNFIEESERRDNLKKKEYYDRFKLMKVKKRNNRNKRAMMSEEGTNDLLKYKEFECAVLKKQWRNKKYGYEGSEQMEGC